MNFEMIWFSWLVFIGMFQAASCIWGWCSAPSSGAACRTSWAVDSVCWYPCPSTASSPSCPPSSKATACSSSAAWCPASGESSSLLYIPRSWLKPLWGIRSDLSVPLLSPRHMTGGYSAGPSSRGREGTGQNQNVGRNERRAVNEHLSVLALLWSEMSDASSRLWRLCSHVTY